MIVLLVTLLYLHRGCKFFLILFKVSPYMNFVSVVVLLCHCDLIL